MTMMPELKERPRITATKKPERAAPRLGLRALFVSETNLLDGSVEAVSTRAMLSALTAHDMPCEAVSRLIVPGDDEVSPDAWLAQLGWPPSHNEQSVSGDHADSPKSGRLLSQVKVHGVPIRLWCGKSTKAHDPDADERAAFVRAVAAALDEQRPDLVLAGPGPCLGDVLAAARARNISTVVLQPDCTPRARAVFQDADLVLAPTRFAAEYLREALGVPCTQLPPFVADEPAAPTASGMGAVAFDYSAPGKGLSVFVQIAAELLRRRPEIPVLILGGEGDVSLPGGAKVQCVPIRERSRTWASARVFLAPTPTWEHLPLSALSAARHGVPVIASDRGALPELLQGGGLLLPLPDRITGAAPALLKAPELAPWVEAILRLYEDSAFAASQS